MPRPLRVSETGDDAETNGGSASLSTDNEVCLWWLEGALQQLSPEGQKKVVGYLEAVLEEVLFETKMPPRPSGLSCGPAARSARQSRGS
jgi:hypothetical protein